jgi:hypothetical protein
MRAVTLATVAFKVIDYGDGEQAETVFVTLLQPEW